MDTYSGKHPKVLSITADKRTVTITVYLATATIVTKVDEDGQVETTIEPII